MEEGGQGDLELMPCHERLLLTVQLGKLVCIVACRIVMRGVT